jgi:primosomal protein N' (replication factor Y)
MQALAAQDRDAFSRLRLSNAKPRVCPMADSLRYHLRAKRKTRRRRGEGYGRKGRRTLKASIFGTCAAPLSVIRGMHRHRFLVRANRGVDVSAFLAAWSARVKLHSAVRVQIDVDRIRSCDATVGRPAAQPSPCRCYFACSFHAEEA